MRQSDESRLRGLYPELLEKPDDAGLVKLVEILDTGYNARRAPNDLRSNPPRPLPAIASDRWSSPIPATRRFRTLSIPSAIVLIGLILVAAGVAFGMPPATSLTDLGRPTNAMPQYQPLSGFRHVGIDLRQSGKAELLFLGTAVDGASAEERWALVKALDQFGTLSDVAATTNHPCVFQRFNQLDCVSPQPPPGFQFPPGFHNQAGGATFDLSRARYASRYVTFVHKDLIDQHLRLQRPTPLERSLFNHYARESGYISWRDAVWHTAIDPNPREPAHQLPVTAVGDYLETGVGAASPEDLTATIYGRQFLLPFSAIQGSLQKGRPVDDAPASLVADENAEANVITALICHADGKQPGTVCGRPVIKTILSHVK